MACTDWHLSSRSIYADNREVSCCFKKKRAIRWKISSVRIQIYIESTEAAYKGLAQIKM